jgi:hypothetical protein
MTAMHKRPSSLDSGTTAAPPLEPDWIGFSGTRLMTNATSR